MEILEAAKEKGVTERRFDLKTTDGVVPGIHWLPEKADRPHPTVLIGHGGTQHKRVPNVLGLARKLVRERGYGVVALDAPGHGDRATEADRAAMAARLARRREGGGRPAADAGAAQRLGRSAPKMVAEWKALLDDLGSNEQWAAGPFGYWGVSMGCAFGLPLVASEPRIAAAVLGLAGLRQGSGQEEMARRVKIPILFLFQWNDELMTRESGVALWQAFGSEEKTMHINPGPHVGIPLFERDAAVSFFQRHLEPAPA